MSRIQGIHVVRILRAQRARATITPLKGNTIQILWQNLVRFLQSKKAA